MIVLVIASVALMTVDHRWQSLELVRGALSGVLYPLQYTIDLPIRLYYWADETLSTQQTLLDKKIWHGQFRNKKKNGSRWTDI